MTDFAHPPSYNSLFGQEMALQHTTHGSGLSFVDFLPACLESGGIFSKPKFEPFSSLIDKANSWLASQLNVEVKTCESVEFKTSGEMVNVEKMTYYESAKYTTWYIRGLRLWIVLRTDMSRSPQQLGYINLIPEVIGESGFFGMPQFESLNDMLHKFNNKQSISPIPGRVLTIESQEMKVPNYSSFNPDRSFWAEHGETSKHFIVVVRIFYQQGLPDVEEIGLADFVPVAISEGGIFSMPQFEPYSNVLIRASQWCGQQHAIRFCNAQSVECKLKTGNLVDTQRMSYTEHGGRTTCYVRILRVAYVKATGAALNNAPHDPPPLQLNCKTFVPLITKQGFFAPEYEGLAQTRLRIEAWMKATGARVLSAETSAMRLYTGGEAYHGAEASFTYNQSNRNEYWIFIIRLYLDGFYHEPPAEMLPPPPVIEDSDCCTFL